MSEAEEVLEEIEALSQNEFLPIIGPDKGEILIEVIRKAKPRRILEIGTLIGYSAILMAKELDSSAHITTIEIHPAEAEQARKNIARAKMSSRIDVIVGDALKVLAQMTGKFDMVFIDATKEEYRKYLDLAERMLHKGSVVVADNAGIFADQMKDYLDYVRTSGKYSSEYVPCGEDGVEVSTKL